MNPVNLFCLLLLLALVFGNTRQPVQEDRHENVENDESPEDTIIAPAVGIAAVYAVKKDIRADVSAVAAAIPILLGSGLQGTADGLRRK